MPICTFARARRQFVIVMFALFAALVGIRAAQGQTEVKKSAVKGGHYVEFLIGDRTDETRKWGHISLRVISPGADPIYDFGRYGKMWGLKNAAEGEPILRVWKSGKFESYRAHHLKDGGTTRRYSFVSSPERNVRINAYFVRMLTGAKVVGSNGTFTAYNSNYKTFHAVEVNCATVTIEAFMQGFPHYNLNDLRYATARSLQFYMMGAAQSHLYDYDERRWTRIWWPLDLMALLDEQFVARGLSQVSPL